MAWADERKEYEEAGFSTEEIQNEEIKVRREMSDSGFRSDEIDSYFGEKRPDLTALRQHFEEAAKKNAPAETAPQLRTPAAGTDPTLIPGGVNQGEAPKPLSPEAAPKKEAMGFIEAFEAGFGMSVTGLFKNGQMPDTILPEHSGMAMRIASQVGTLAGDIPAMLAGAYAGGAAGAAAGSAVSPGVGTAVGAALGRGAGAMALPAAMRQILVDHYQKGDIKSFGDFWERASATFLESGKAAITGAATIGAGAIAGKALTAASPLIRAGGTAAAEVATMTVIGKALEGQVPEFQDFADAAVLVGGLHAIGVVGPRLQNIYAKTGLKPDQVAEMASTDPVLKQEIAQSDALPESLKPLADPASPPPPPVKSETVKLGDSEIEVKSDAISPKEPTQNVVEMARDPNEQKVLDRIASPAKKSQPLTWDKAYTDAVDNLHPIKVMQKALTEGKALSPKDDPYQLARLSRGSYGKADQFIDLAPFKFDTLENIEGVKPLKKILQPFAEDVEGFKAYAVSARTLELAGREVETGVDLESAKAVVKTGKKKYGQAMEELTKYQNSTLQYLRDSGIVSKDAFEKMTEANKNYVPFFRLQDEKPLAPGAAGKGLTVRNPVKGIKGSERAIVDPIESIVKNTYLYVTLAERNRVLSAMVDLAGKSPELGEKLFVKKAIPMRGIEVTREEVGKFLEEHGMSKDDAEAFDIFRPVSKTLGPNEIQLFRDGKREIYEVPPELARAVKALDKETVGPLMKLISLPAKGLRAGSVLSPEFMVRNFSRDAMTAFNLGQGFFSPIDAIKGMGSFLKKDEHYQNWLKGGGANSAMQTIDRQYIQSKIFELDKEVGVLGKTWNVLKSPLEYASAMSELIENSTRIGEFKRVNKGEVGADAIFKGSFAAREVTLDFQRIGAKMQAMNLITAFFNAHVQGLDKAARTFKERPTETGLKVAASITLPSVLLYLSQKDDPRWGDIPNWQKDLFWIVMTNDHIYRIPKPGELGLVFGSLPERTLEAYFHDNPRAFKDLDSTLLQAFTPSYVPTALTPVVEHWANKSTFTGGRLIPSGMESILPEYQYNAYTTESGKLLAKVVSFIPGQNQPGSLGSPIVLENYIRAWSGQLGSYALKLADQALIAAKVVPDPVKPASSLADIPVIKAFVVRYPSSGMQPIIDFYDKFQENEVVMNSIRHNAKLGKMDEVKKQFELDANSDKIYRLREVQTGMSNINRYIQFVQSNTQLTPDEKRQQIENAYLGMNEMAKAGLKLSDEITKITKGKK